VDILEARNLRRETKGEKPKKNQAAEFNGQVHEESKTHGGKSLERNQRRIAQQKNTIRSTRKIKGLKAKDRKKRRIGRQILAGKSSGNTNPRRGTKGEKSKKDRAAEFNGGAHEESKTKGKKPKERSQIKTQAGECSGVIHEESKTQGRNQRRIGRQQPTREILEDRNRRRETK